MRKTLVQKDNNSDAHRSKLVGYKFDEARQVSEKERKIFSQKLTYKNIDEQIKYAAKDTLETVDSEASFSEMRIRWIAPPIALPLSSRKRTFEQMINS